MEVTFSQDPLFADPSADDYRLGRGSPCVEAGTNDAPALPASDADGNPRVFDADCDGASDYDADGDGDDSDADGGDGESER